MLIQVSGSGFRATTIVLPTLIAIDGAVSFRRRGQIEAVHSTGVINANSSF